MFKQLTGAQALLKHSSKSGTLYAPSDVYEGPDNGLYCAVRSGFARIRANGGTSLVNVMVVRLEIDTEIYRDRFGRVSLKEDNNTRLAGAEWSHLCLPDYS